MLYINQEVETLKPVEKEQANFRAALRWALGHSQVEKAIAAEYCLRHILVYSRILAGGPEVAETCLTQSENESEEVKPQWRAKALHVSGRMISLREDLDWLRPDLKKVYL